MKKLLLTTVLVSSAVLGFTGNVHANEQNKITETPEKTDVGINFKTDGGSTIGQGPFSDHLAIVFKPTKFDFGTEQEAIPFKKVYTEKVDASNIKKNKYLIVNDDRKTAGSAVAGSPWHVTATYSGLSEKGNASNTLESALKIKLEPVQKYTIGTDKDPITQDIKPNDPNDPASNAITDFSGAEHGEFRLGADLAANASAEVELSNTATTVFGRKEAATAIGTEGVATRISETNLTIEDGTGADGKTFVGSVTWQLADTYK
ncbi:WxL domain-containing protein [Enterococcus wangshanyuanii]|uniref:WxL domain-containing protein n=1 Tax=Enterococcus wangshanyuanii TaxID=2005703 RepID=A0ABQ1PPN3_9ENTE|nr:WxL domain-containing protein [Enterococcus wangshanyuanii]GGD00630.1 hypothetical protein GCM10011573_32770 [Enterococcus wangshanyuanii]